MKNYKKIWNIKSIKQDNGLFGMPVRVVKYDPIAYINEELELLNSAIIIALAEKYKNCYIELKKFGSLNTYYYRISNYYDINIKNGFFNIENYKFINNVLYLKK